MEIQVQVFDNYNNLWDFYGRYGSVQEAKNTLSQLIYGVFKIIKADRRGHYKTIGFYQANNYKLSKLQ